MKRIFLLLLLAIPAQAYTVFQLAPGIPVNIEKSFIAATTTQFLEDIRTRITRLEQWKGDIDGQFQSMADRSRH